MVKRQKAKILPFIFASLILFVISAIFVIAVWGYTTGDDEFEFIPEGWTVITIYLSEYDDYHAWAPFVPWVEITPLGAEYASVTKLISGELSIILDEDFLEHIFAFEMIFDKTAINAFEVMEAQMHSFTNRGKINGMKLPEFFVHHIDNGIKFELMAFAVIDIFINDYEFIRTYHPRRAQLIFGLGDDGQIFYESTTIAP